MISLNCSAKSKYSIRNGMSNNLQYFQRRRAGKERASLFKNFEKHLNLS